MTDEMTIQQRKSPLVPTVLGAAAGTGIGYGVGHLMTKPMTHDDIIKDINDTTTFSNRVKEGAPEAATWQEVKNKADEVAGLKEKLAQAEKGVPTDTKLKADLEAAQKNYDSELEKLMKSKNGGSETITSKFPSRKVLETELSTSEFKQIEPYLQRYEAAQKRLRKKGMKGTPVETEFRTLKTTKESLETSYGKIVKYYKALSDKNKSKYDPLKDKFTSKEINSLVDARLPKNYSSYDYKKFAEMRDKFGSEIFEFSETPVSGAHKKMNPTTGKYEWITVNKDALNSARETMRENFASNIEKMKELSIKVDKLEEEFFEANKDDLKDIKKPIKSVKDLKNLKEPKRLKELLDGMDVLKLSIEKKVESYPVTLGTGSSSITFNNEKQLEKFVKQIELELELSKKLSYEVGIINREAYSIINEDIAVKTAKEKLQDKIANDSGIKRALDKFDELNGRYATDSEKALHEKVKGLMDVKPSETVPAMTREEAIKKLESSHVAKKLAEKQELFDNAVKEGKTKVDDAAVKTAKEALENGEKSLKEMAESLGKKITKGPNKWVAAGIGAAALGLATLLAVNSKNNKAQA